MLTSKQFDHRGFTSSVRTYNTHYFGTMNGSFIRSKGKLTKFFLQSTPTHNRSAYLCFAVTMSKEFYRFVSDSYVLLWKKTIEITVDGLAG